MGDKKNDTIATKNIDFTKNLSTQLDRNITIDQWINDQDFFASLVGFAGTLANIQDRGETMMDGIRSQREELLMLERKAEEADRKRKEADNIAEKVEEDNKKIETELSGKKEELLSQETEVTKFDKLKSKAEPFP